MSDVTGKVMIVPGYGMAVSQAQRAVADIASYLKEKEINTRFSIHPVAGRMPGQMNVLLAEAGVPYDWVHEMDEVQDEMSNVDVCLVVGANDITNEAAEVDEDCSIYGMPVVKVWEAKNCIYLKRSMAGGYADIENPVFFRETTQMLLGFVEHIAPDKPLHPELRESVISQTQIAIGDGKASCEGIAAALKSKSCASESDGDASSIKLLLSAFEGRPPVIFFDYPPAVGKAKEVDPARILFLDELSRRYPEVLFSHPGVVHRYNAVLNTIYNAGLAEVAADTGKWTLLWSGTPKPEALREFQPFQKTNHFPASNHLGRKDLLWRNIRLMQQRFPDGRFDITPQTFLVPSHFKFWVAAREGDPKALWIWKPCNSSCGRGIKLLPRNVSAKVQAKLESKNGVIQRYIERPLLINGYKFDLRLYVVVTSFDPLKVYLFHEGLVRLATERYTLSSKTLRRRTMHLTNYAVNKNSAAYVRNCDSQATSVCGSELRRELQHSPSPDPEEEPDAEDDAATYDGTDEADLTDVFNSEEEAEDPVDETPKASAVGEYGLARFMSAPASMTIVSGEKATGDGRSTSKWSLKDLREHFDAEGIDYDMVMSQIKDTIIKTLIAAETPIVSAWHNGANYRGANRSWRPVGPNQTCFELFGFDVLLDETLRPWLLEVNTCPSLSSSSPLDKRLKTQLVADMLTLVGLSAGREEVGGCRSTCSASRPGTTEQKARFFRSHTVDGLASESIRLRDLGEAEWSTIMDAHDEYLRRGCFERIYPCETVDEYQALLASGATVVGFSRNPGKDGLPKELLTESCDVRDREKLSVVFAKHAPFDILVSAATGGERAIGPFLSMDLDGFQNSFDKLWGYANVVRLGAEHMTEKGSIVLVSGAPARRCKPGQISLSCVGAAVENLVRALAPEIVPRRINVVSPGLVETPMFGPDSEERHAKLAKMSSGNPIPRAGKPEEVAQAIMFLLTNEFVTGTTVDVDGGWLCANK
ncbi:pntB [Symbiodinium sp. KB8]|nr:pntB [Symbiodinium sp. KB8]